MALSGRQYGNDQSNIVVIQFPVDVAFPYFHDVVALTSQVLDLFHCRTMEFLHGFAIDQVHGIASVTFWASVPETAIDFVRRMGFLVIAVKQIGTNTFLATVACVLNKFRSFRPCTRAIYEQTRIVCSWGNIPTAE